MVLGFDPNVPSQLKSIQKWFAGIITTPVDINNCIRTISPNGKPIDQEASKYIAPSPTLLPHQRIQIYNQQYWWRLISIMHDNFPMLTRLFGYNDFNYTFAIPYLEKFPPNHWSLNTLGNNFPQWVQKHYQKKDRELIINCAFIDQAFCSIFVMGNYPELHPDQFPNPRDPSSILEHKLYLQPYVQVFSLNMHLFKWRELLLKEKVEYWEDHDFPELEKNGHYYIVFYRTKNNSLSWKDISEAEFRLLKAFQKGATLEEACLSLEGHSSIMKDYEERLPEWFQDWTLRHWLSLSNSIVSKIPE